MFEVEEDALDGRFVEELVEGCVVGGCGQEDDVEGCRVGDDHGEPDLVQAAGDVGVEFGDGDGHVAEVCDGMC